MCCLFFPLSKWRHLSFPTSFSSISSCCSLHFLFISFCSFSSGSPPPSTSHGCPISLSPPFLFTYSLPLLFPHYLTLSYSITFSLDYPISPSPSLTYSIFQPCSPAVSSTTFWPTSSLLPGPLIKACRTASPWAEERESARWGDEGIRAERREEETDRDGIERHERGGTERSQGQEEEAGALSAQGQKLFLADHTHTHTQRVLSAPSFLVMYVMCKDGVDINVVW